ncbi:hypothetical protein PALA111701_01155 [Paenibacillus lactis]
MLKLLDEYSLNVGREGARGMTKDLEFASDDLLSPEEIDVILAQLEEEIMKAATRRGGGND